MKKSVQHKYILMDHGRVPFFWDIAHENETFVGFRNWITGERCVYRK